MAMINRKELGQQLEAIGSADILVGIPSFNNARTIGHVVKAVQAGLAKYFPEHKSVLVNSDGGSSDGTMNVVNQAVIEDLHPLLVRHRVEPFHKIAMPYAGIPGKGSAFRAIFELADHFGARACAVVDSDLRSITPEWMELLLKPVLNEGFDFVAPQYHRHKYDGTITNSIIYPDPGTVRQEITPAHRGRFRLFGTAGPVLSRQGCLENRHRPLWHRYLDDQRGPGQWIQDGPGFSWRQDTRREGSGLGPERHDGPGRGFGLQPHGRIL
jgi:glycosyltransferase involved in cell wall biosynthesis